MIKMPKVFEDFGPGVLEYWSIGVMVRGLMSLYATLQYSITPILRFQGII
jgi:hypothetical protein